MAKTNFTALENDLELHNEYFKHISDAIENAVKQSQKSTAIEYRADKRFTDILTVLKWKGYKIKHYRCTNSHATYYQDPIYEELQYEPTCEVIKDRI
jgi:ribosomal protein S8